MARTVAGLFPNRRAAEAAQAELEAAGFNSRDISLLTREPEATQQATPERTAKSLLGSIIGSLIVGTLGALVAWALSVLFSTPPTGKTLSVILVSCVGGTIGWLIGLLYPGEPVEEREYYRERAELGKAVLTADAQGRELEARHIMAQHRARGLPTATLSHRPSTGLQWRRPREMQDSQRTAMWSHWSAAGSLVQRSPTSARAKRSACD